MISNFFKTALRALLKRKLHSFINIAGLAIGMTATLLIISYVYFELSYDRYNQNFQNIYRVLSDISLPNGNTLEGPLTVGDLAPKMQTEIPGIKKATRIFGYRRSDIIVEDKTFTTTKIIWADSTFFEIFSFKFISGNAKTALVEPYSIVVTKQYAERLFGNQDAYNKVIRIRDDNFKITGVIEDIPLNSHIRFDFVGSFSSVSNEKRDVVKESVFNFFTYVWCEEKADFRNILEKTDIFVNESVNNRLKGMEMKTVSSLQPLKDIHLNSSSEFEMEPSGDINSVYIFAVLAIFIIIIAIVNFINLATANSESRAKEIGLRKVMGANRQQLFIQFNSEAILISFIAFVIAIGLAQLFITSFQELMGSPIILPYWGNHILLASLILGIIVIGFIAGSYPALYLSRFLPINTLKGGKSSSKKNTTLRKLLVVFQFSIAIFLLINLSLLYTQVNYMKNKDLGFDKDQVLVISNFTDKIRNSYTSLKADLLMKPDIISVSASNGVPGMITGIEAMHKNGEEMRNAVAIHETRVQFDYIETMGIKIIEGRSFLKEMGTERKNVILNEAAVKALGLVNPINKSVIMIDDTLKVIGVCKDFHHKSLYNPIEPHVHTIRYKYFNTIVIKLNSKDIPLTVKSIEQIFKDVDSNLIFDYSFMDQRFADMYQKEERTNKLITYSAILAIIISMLGLFALTSFTIQQKTQEIGIRKVMGAEIRQVVYMFVASLTKWVLLAAIIAIPVSYYSMSCWLERFPFHTDIKIWMFVSGGLLALVISVLTVAFITFKAAKTNPTDSLKYE